MGCSPESGRALETALRHKLSDPIARPKIWKRQLKALSPYTPATKACSDPRWRRTVIPESAMAHRQRASRPITYDFGGSCQGRSFNSGIYHPDALLRAARCAARKSVPELLRAAKRLTSGQGCIQQGRERGDWRHLRGARVWQSKSGPRYLRLWSQMAFSGQRCS